MRGLLILSLVAAFSATAAWGQDYRSNTRTQSQRNRLYNTGQSDTYAQRNSAAGGGNTGATAGGMSNAGPRLSGIQIAPAGMSIVGGSQAPGGGMAGGTGAYRANTRTHLTATTR